jgi:serine/threonine-protein kinase RsbT
MGRPRPCTRGQAKQFRQPVGITGTDAGIHGSTVADSIQVVVRSNADILTARQRGRELAEELGFPPTDLTFIATAISSLARNIVRFAKEGEIAVSAIEQAGRRGIAVVASDQGPGIPKDRMTQEFEVIDTGVGLRGVKRMMDEMQIESDATTGTTITARKWLR